MLLVVSLKVNAQDRNEAWLMYDNGTFYTSIGLMSGEPIYWANMFTPTQLASYDGYSLTKIKMWDHTAYNGFLMVYQDNSTTGPADLVYTQQYSMTGTNDWAEFELTTPVAIDITKNLWITFNNSDGEYTIAACDDTGDANSRWISTDGRQWDDASTVGMPPFTWMIRGLISDQASNVIELGGAMQVYPNPAANVLNVSAEGMTRISVYNTIGQMVYNQEVTDNFVTLNVADYQSGIYMVSIETNSGRSVKQVSIVK